MARQANGEDATDARHVPHRQSADVRLDALAGDGKAQTQSRPVMTVLIEGREHLGGDSRWQPSAVIFDFDQDVLAKLIGLQGDIGMRVRELERVLQEVCQCGEQQFAVSPDGQQGNRQAAPRRRNLRRLQRAGPRFRRP